MNTAQQEAVTAVLRCQKGAGCLHSRTQRASALQAKSRQPGEEEAGSQCQGNTSTQSGNEASSYLYSPVKYNSLVVSYLHTHADTSPVHYYASCVSVYETQFSHSPAVAANTNGLHRVHVQTLNMYSILTCEYLLVSASSDKPAKRWSRTICEMD